MQANPLWRGRVFGRLFVCALALICGFVVAHGAGLTEKPQVLFRAAEFPKGWTFFSAEKDRKLTDIWRVKKADDEVDDVLICLGKPFGYLKTETVYQNYEFALEWRYPDDPNCNSGILIHTKGEDKIWPSSIQIQLHRPTAGSLFPLGGAKSDNTVQVKSPKLALKEWHKCIVRCEEGKVTVTINGKEVGKITGCDPAKGAISLQSEGSEIHFRRIRLRKLK